MIVTHIRRCLLLVCLLLAGHALAVSEISYPQPHIAKLTLDGPIGPATTDYLTRSMTLAEAQGASAIVLVMDTPGGLDAATRDIIKAILASRIPIITYVHPAGSRAASAGTYILYASHVAAMTPSTTLGAATPVQISPGGALPGRGKQDDPKTEKKDSEPSPASAMERKVINDAVAFIRGLAARHGRNAEWAERAVREAVSLTASEALEKNVVDIVAVDVSDLLAQVDGRELKLPAGPSVLASADVPVHDYAPDWRNDLLALITNPQIASILLLIGMYGLILEGYSPGALVPGVVGIICLLIALYALQVLPVNYAGVALIIVGGLLILAEVFAPSFGILGIGGVVAIVVGSLILVDSDVPGMEVSYQLVGAMAAASTVLLLVLLGVAGRSIRRPILISNQAMVGRTALVRQVDVDAVADQELPHPSRVNIDGELWHAWSTEPVHLGQEVTIVAQNGLILEVKPLTHPREREL